MAGVAKTVLPALIMVSFATTLEQRLQQNHYFDVFNGGKNKLPCRGELWRSSRIIDICVKHFREREKLLALRVSSTHKNETVCRQNMLNIAKLADKNGFVAVCLMMYDVLVFRPTGKKKQSVMFSTGGGCPVKWTLLIETDVDDGTHANNNNFNFWVR